LCLHKIFKSQTLLCLPFQAQRKCKVHHDSCSISMKFLKVSWEERRKGCMGFKSSREELCDYFQVIVEISWDYSGNSELPFVSRNSHSSFSNFTDFSLRSVCLSQPQIYYVCPLFSFPIRDSWNCIVKAFLVMVLKIKWISSGNPSISGPGIRTSSFISLQTTMKQ
jgi:hypothetical protein